MKLALQAWGVATGASWRCVEILYTDRDHSNP